MMMYIVSYFCTKMHHFKAKFPIKFPTPARGLGPLFVGPHMEPPSNEIPAYGPVSITILT